MLSLRNYVLYPISWQFFVVFLPTPTNQPVAGSRPNGYYPHYVWFHVPHFSPITVCSTWLILHHSTILYYTSIMVGFAYPHQHTRMIFHDTPIVSPTISPTIKCYLFQ